MAALQLTDEDFEIIDQVQQSLGLKDEQFLRFLSILNQRELRSLVQTHQIKKERIQKEQTEKQMKMILESWQRKP